jgi:hypothetical protein
MTEMRFHRSIYRGEALDEAMKVYGSFGTFDRAEEEQHWVVRLTARRAPQERQVAGEFANYALGLTIRRGTAP